MKLVDDWKDCWKWFSTQALAISIALQTAWLTMPEKLKSEVPSGLVEWLIVAILVAGVIGRVVKQKESDISQNIRAEFDKIDQAFDDVNKDSE